MKSVLDVLHRKIRIRLPRWASTEGRFFDVIQHPSTPLWRYLPCGPFQLVRIDLIDPTMLYGYEDEATLADLLSTFVLLHLPRINEACEVLDLNHQIVLGWQSNAEGVRWWGCERVFAELEKYADPLDVAYWRQSAEHQDMLETGEFSRG